MLIKNGTFIRNLNSLNQHFHENSQKTGAKRIFIDDIIQESDDTALLCYDPVANLVGFRVRPCS